VGASIEHNSCRARIMTANFAQFGGMRNPWFACDDHPLSFFRVCFFAGLISHFVPFALDFETNLGRTALRTCDWDQGLFELWGHASAAARVALVCVTYLALLCGLVGVLLRAAVLVAAIGTYCLASANSLNVQTLALGAVWGVFVLWGAMGGGDEVLTLWPRTGPATSRAAVRIGRFLVIAVWLSGLQKLDVGWLTSNEMGVLLQYPRGSVLRGWATGLRTQDAEILGWLAGYATLAFELAMPVLAIMQRAQHFVRIAWPVFFFAIFALLEVPPLFVLVFAPAAALCYERPTR
jgi:hypothetical protein